MDKIITLGKNTNANIANLEALAQLKLREAQELRKQIDSIVLASIEANGFDPAKVKIKDGAIKDGAFTIEWEEEHNDKPVCNDESK